MLKLRNIFLFVLILIYTPFLFAKERIALVIGNTGYEVSPLRTAINDASDVADTLSQLGFTVSLKTDASQSEMEIAVQEFGRSIQAGAIGLFYYAGHAVQHNGENYLVPVNSISSITAPEHLRYKTVPLGYVLGVVDQSASDLNVVILDACRNSPFKGFSRDLTRGITRMPSSQGTLVAYSTSPGKVALDGNASDRNSPYTKNLLKHIKEPGLTIEQVLKKVRTSVKKDTNGEQAPWYEASIDGDFYFIQGSPKLIPGKNQKVIKVATAKSEQKILPKKEEKKAIKNEVINSTPEYTFLGFDDLNKDAKLNAAQVRGLFTNNTLLVTSGSFDNARIFFGDNARVHYVLKTETGKIIEGKNSWHISQGRVCVDLHQMGTNGNGAEQEVCYRIRKDEDKTFKLYLTHAKLSGGGREKTFVGKYITGKVIKGREINH